MRSRRDAIDNPHAVAKGGFDAEKLLAEPYVSSPLRAHDCPANCDGATAIVIVAGERARKLASGRSGSAASTTESIRPRSACAT